MPVTIDCFKAYDVRGQIPNQLNADICYRIGNATAEFLGAKRVVVGRDMRLSSNEFADAVSRGLVDAGVDVLDDRSLVPDGDPIGHEARAPTLPEGRRGAEGEQVRQEVAGLAHEVDA